MNSIRWKTLGAAMLAICALSLASAVDAAQIEWVDWTAANTTSASGATAGGITVSFSGNLNPAAQTAGGTDYWASFPSTYTSPPIVDNAPPDSDIIRLEGGVNTGVQVLTFSKPVENPVMAILSLGQSGVPVNYDFDTPFDILNVGPGFFDGGGTGTLVELAGDILQGVEGHGLIQFQGTVTSISWTTPDNEFWHGFQIGVVPEPSSLALVALGLVGLIGLALRKK
jgi:hypothetical protein